MINHSAKALGVKLKAITKKGSQEPKETNTTSIVAQKKKNRYGV
jgi:hypothetical protein